MCLFPSVKREHLIRLDHREYVFVSRKYMYVWLSFLFFIDDEKIFSSKKIILIQRVIIPRPRSNLVLSFSSMYVLPVWMRFATPGAQIHFWHAEACENILLAPCQMKNFHDSQDALHRDWNENFESEVVWVMFSHTSKCQRWLLPQSWIKTSNSRNMITNRVEECEFRTLYDQ